MISQIQHITRLAIKLTTARQAEVFVYFDAHAMRLEVRAYRLPPQMSIEAIPSANIGLTGAAASKELTQVINQLTKLDREKEVA